jgi:hypothetical protein
MRMSRSWRRTGSWTLPCIALGLVGCGLSLGIDRYRDCQGAECRAPASDASAPDANRLDASDASDAPFCVGDGAITTGNASNCGACGHSCLGGACVTNACAPSVLVGTTGSRSIVVDAANLYFLSNYQLSYCPLSGCSQPTLLTKHTGATLSSLAQSGTKLLFTAWWTQNNVPTGDLEMATKGFPGQDPVVIALSPNQPGGVQICNQSVCWVDGSLTQSSVNYCSASMGCSPTEISNLPGPMNEPLAWDGANVYFSDSNYIYTAPFGGGAPQPVLARYNVQDLAFRNGHLYWLEAGIAGEATVASCLPSSCKGTFTALATLKGATLGRMAVDDQYVYWTVDEDPHGAVLRCGIDGCNGLPEAVAREQAGPGAIAIDDTRIYWSNDQANLGAGAIVWVAK